MAFIVTTYERVAMGWEGNNHVGSFCKFGYFERLHRAYFMCNWAKIQICWFHCICNIFVFLPLKICWPKVEQVISAIRQ